MVQSLTASAVTLRDLIDRVQLQELRDQAAREFFPEWHQSLPDLTEADRQALDKIRAGYLNLLQSPPLLERSVQFSVVAPLLFWADLYLPPFQPRCEESVSYTTPNGNTQIRGDLDAVILRDRVWLLIIESKQAHFSVEAGLAQLLAYLLAQTHPELPSYGLVTTGGNFLFVKLLQRPNQPPCFATSDEFALRTTQGNSLYRVFQILKKLTQTPPNTSSLLSETPS